MKTNSDSQTTPVDSTKKKEDPPKHVTQVQQQIFEVYTTEEAFNLALQQLAAIHDFVKDRPDVPPSVKAIFKQGQELVATPIKRPEGITNPSDFKDINGAILNLRQQFNHPEYFNKLINAVSWITVYDKELKNMPTDVIEKINQIAGSLGITSLLIKPVQRMPRLQLFGREMIETIGKAVDKARDVILNKVDNKQEYEPEFHAISQIYVKEMGKQAQQMSADANYVQALNEIAQENPHLIQADVLLSPSTQSFDDIHKISKIIDDLTKRSKTTSDFGDPFLRNNYKNAPNSAQGSGYLALIVLTSDKPAAKIEALIDLAKFYQENNELIKANNMLKSAADIYVLESKTRLDVDLYKAGQHLNAWNHPSDKPTQVTGASEKPLREVVRFIEAKCKEVKVQGQALMENKALEPGEAVPKLIEIREKRAQVLIELKAVKRECENYINSDNPLQKSQMKKDLSSVNKLLKEFTNAEFNNPTNTAKPLKERTGLFVKFKQEMVKIFPIDVSSKRICTKFKKICKDNNLQLSHIHLHRERSATVTVRNDSSFKQFLKDNDIQFKVVKKGSKESKIKLDRAELNQFLDVAKQETKQKNM